MAPASSSSSQHFAINSFLVFILIVVIVIIIVIVVISVSTMSTPPHDVGDPLLVGPAVRHQQVQLVPHLVVNMGMEVEKVVVELEVVAPTRMTLLLAPRRERSPGQTEPGKSRRSTTTSTSASTSRRWARALGQGVRVVLG